jgi:ribosomal protein L37AE/L43A
MATGRYRLRTMLRERLPAILADLIAKGPEDCGDHEWYKAEEQIWRCYHCEPGITHSVPWDARELEARRYEAGAMLIRAGIERSERPAMPHH